MAEDVGSKGRVPSKMLNTTVRNIYLKYARVDADDGQLCGVVCGKFDKTAIIGFVISTT